MGVTTRGLDEWLADLQSLPARAPKAFAPVVSKGALNIKNDWLARWKAIARANTHIPHLIRRGGIGYDTARHGDTYSADIGIPDSNRQAFLAGIIEGGTHTSPPHPGALPALEDEAPRFAQAAADVGVDLLDGTK